MEHSIKVVIADDHEIFRDGFKLLLKDQKKLKLAGEADNGRELLQVTDVLQPDVVITDIQMPVMDGIEACKVIREKYPAIQVIALSMFNEDNLIVDMLEAGAAGYLLKNTNKQELLEAVETVYEGGNYYSAATSTKLARLIGKSKFTPYNEAREKLTEREMDIVRLVCKQYTNKEIASALNLSPRTIESHREKIQEKVKAKNVIGVVIYAIKHNIYKIE
jgi:DNA-binding NarL/FixJ family response regulator